MNDTRSWPVANPYIERRIVTTGDIDEFGHVNNVRYVAWAMDVAWAHSKALGLSFEDYARIGAGCVVWRHEFEFTKPALKDDEIAIATWIAKNDGRVRLRRAFEMRRLSDSAVLFTGHTLFVAVDLSTGAPTRMPAEFVKKYKPAVLIKE